MAGWLWEGESRTVSVPSAGVFKRSCPGAGSGGHRTRAQAVDEDGILAPPGDAEKVVCVAGPVEADRTVPPDACRYGAPGPLEGGIARKETFRKLPVNVGNIGNYPDEW